MGLTDETHRTGPLAWIDVKGKDLKLGDIILVCKHEGQECYGIVTRCYETSGGMMFCHMDIGMDSIPQMFQPETVYMIGRADASAQAAQDPN